jgi:hypothetical protein
MKCRECGAELYPGQTQFTPDANQGFGTSLGSAQQTGDVCSLCGRYKGDRYQRLKRIMFGLLKAFLLVATAIEIYFYIARTTQRSAAANDALARMNASTALVELLGRPIKVKSGMKGEIHEDETGWKEARLTIPVQGPNGGSSCLCSWRQGDRGLGVQPFRSADRKAAQKS